MVKLKERITYGIALCRNNIDKNNRTEVLMIKKRYTYEFFNFLYNTYNWNDKDALKRALDNMSYSEKIDILSMRFEIMWYRVWLNNPSIFYDICDNYKNNNRNITYTKIHKKFLELKKQFEDNYILTDTKNKLRNLIINSKNSETIWEYPKGAPLENELPLDCAIREFKEETSIDYKNIKILDIEPIIISIVEENVKYTQIYFLAIIKNKINTIRPKIYFDKYNQISEIEKIKWVSLAEIEFMNLPKSKFNYIYQNHKRIIDEFKKYKRDTNKLIL